MVRPHPSELGGQGLMSRILSPLSSVREGLDPSPWKLAPGRGVGSSLGAGAAPVAHVLGRGSREVGVPL